MNTNVIDSGSDQAALRTELVARAAKIVPLLRSNGPKADEARRLPEESVSALEGAGLFRICSPKRFGGYEGDIRTYMDAIAEVGRGCGSAAWVAFISNTGAWIAGYFPDDAQKEIFDGNPDTRFIGVLAPTATTRKVEGGYAVTGRWGYASGSLHAHWALLTAPIDQDDGSKGLGLILVPMKELSIEDTWFSVGVRGSGSNTVIADDVFVPDRRVIPLSAVMAHNGLGDPARTIAYRQAFAATAVIAVAAPVLGMANAALEMTRERMSTGGKRIAYSVYDDVRRSPAMQLQLAEAASLIEVGNTIVKGWCDRIVSSAATLQELSFNERAQMRAELGLAMRHCREGVDLLLSVQGASAFAESNPVQRVWRDIETATRHGLLSPEVPLEIYGRALFEDYPALSAFV
ncbi:Acyl-CoA dehydrogenase, C-terminal domain protein [Agrobacterium deltaense Zutra 3/1]|uniref:Acyl-CoA dehydrogenase, C-terminal domain protein n=1 Tax=Agrobacterium deltaense Zutra 3/1 TaxID=1183427 RepID=A0A1S7S295_9HYPH|nr:acyl-CoA dehydrogenase family protein [Agrobacterium deltaense]CUX61477.1 Acyl-CoA dehydrogenase, C-terminal domain protein [Agrobacterium deltaense Zutra 3/1]